jgi:5-methylcytosine-specific restriction endonuclease McrA
MKISKFRREEVLSAIRQCRSEGLNQVETAKRLKMRKYQVASYCHRYGITGWPIGAAARDQRGNKNPSYKNGLSRASIGRLTKKVLADSGRDLFQCEKCGLRGEIELPRHHIDRDRSNNSPDNLWVLCQSCHNREHMSERERDTKGRLLCRLA